LARPALGQVGDLLREPIGVDNVGIEVVDEPFFQFAIALVFGIGDGFEELRMCGIAAGDFSVFTGTLLVGSAMTGPSMRLEPHLLSPGHITSR
jgi:hypothetical protein